MTALAESSDRARRTPALAHVYLRTSPDPTVDRHPLSTTRMRSLVRSRVTALVAGSIAAGALLPHVVRGASRVLHLPTRQGHVGGRAIHADRDRDGWRDGAAIGRCGHALHLPCLHREGRTPHRGDGRASPGRRNAVSRRSERGPLCVRRGLGGARDGLCRQHAASRLRREGGDGEFPRLRVRPHRAVGRPAQAWWHGFHPGDRPRRRDGLHRLHRPGRRLGAPQGRPVRDGAALRCQRSVAVARRERDDQQGAGDAGSGRRRHRRARPHDEGDRCALGARGRACGLRSRRDGDRGLRPAAGARAHRLGRDARPVRLGLARWCERRDPSHCHPYANIGQHDARSRDVHALGAAHARGHLSHRQSPDRPMGDAIRREPGHRARGDAVGRRPRRTWRS